MHRKYLYPVRYIIKHNTFYKYFAFPSDIVQNRLNVAKQLGADYTVLVQKDDSDETLVKKIVNTLGQQPDISLDCSGAEICVRTAVQVNARNKFDINSINNL